jgi:hypothetical protein
MEQFVEKYLYYCKKKKKYCGIIKDEVFDSQINVSSKQYARQNVHS